MDTNDSNAIYNELLILRGELIRLKMQTYEFENSALREKMKRNAAMKRDLKRELKSLHKKVQPELPF